MLDALYSRIAGMDLKRPYVWKLRISSAEFKALEAAVQDGTTGALQNVVYLAEWYKRRYDGGAAKPVREFDCQKLFEESGIVKTGNLFETESGSKTWRYSIYVLGGVSIPFELGKKSTRFLKELCRIYYGEEGDIDQLGEKDRAAAFRESVRSYGSIYEYLKEVITDSPPFAADDLADKASPENLFIGRIKSANDAVLRSKFDLEWVIGFNPDTEYMTRRLRLLLKPESLGGENHRYLKYERVALWGIGDPGQCKLIRVGARYLLDGETVREPDFAKPLLTCQNTGAHAAGFLALHTERCSKTDVAPAAKFNEVEVVARDDKGKDHVVEKFKVDDWMQVFRVPEKYNEWTSRHCAQRVSAVICPVDFEMLDVGPTETIHKKRFRVKGAGASDVYQWRAVYDTVRFKTPDGGIVTVFNRQGYDQIVTRLHTDILRYHDGCVNYTVDQDGEWDEVPLPLVFGKDDIVVRHFESLNDMKDDNPTEGAFEKIEFLHGGAYHEWTDSEVPEQGKTVLRITVKGVQRKMTVYNLPLRIVRDCEKGTITIGEEVIEDEIVRDHSPTDPVVFRSVGTDEEFVSLEIWRATKHKEFVRNGKVVEYVEDGEEAEISYILKDGLVIHDFSADGYREYACGEMGNIYRLPEFSPRDNGHLSALLNSTRCRVSSSLDTRAPEWLWVNLAKASEKTAAQKMLYWDYTSGMAPVCVGDDVGCNGNDIKFADLENGIDGLCVRPPEIGESDPFAAFEDGTEADPVDAFEVATKHRVYYFAMQPLHQEHLHLPRDIIKALVKRRENGFTDADTRGLWRFAEEFGLDVAGIAESEFT